jgi:hypothetical protein
MAAAKGMRVRLDPQDEYTHPIEAALQREYVLQCIRPRRLDRRLVSGSRIDRMKAAARLSCCVYLPDGRVGFMFARPEGRTNDAFNGGGMAFDIVEPFKRLTVKYNGKLCLMKNPKDMADPAYAFKNNPVIPAEIDLDHEGASPMFGGEPINADGSKIEQKAEESFARGHYEQHMVGRGTIKIDGAQFKIDGLGLRDHSWGPRYWQAIHWFRWLPMNFSRDFAMMVSITCAPNAAPRKGGMVLRNNEYVMIRDARIESKYDADQCQTEFTVWAKTDEREYSVAGKVMSLIPLRNRRKTPDGDELLTRITEGMTEYTCDGQVGYGLSEYLDQIVDGVPVGLSVGS